MVIAEDRIRVEKAKEQGRMARRVGKRHGDNPYRGSTPLVRALHQAWQEGWQEEDITRRARR